MPKELRAFAALAIAIFAVFLTGEFMAIWFAKGERLIRVNTGRGYEDRWVS